MNKSTYRCDFERIGRSRTVEPLTIMVPENDDVAYAISEKVHRYARGKLASRDVEVVTELGDEPTSGGKGTIFAGFQVGGAFTVTYVGEAA